MEVGHIHAPEGSIFPETLPRFCTLAWCVSGQFSFSGRGWSLPAQAGQVAAIGPGQYFSTDAQKDGCEAYYLLMDGPSMEELIAKTGLWTGVFPYLNVPITWLEYLAANIHDLSQHSTLATTGHSLFQDAYQQAERSAKDTLVWKTCCYLHRNWWHPDTNVEMVLKHLGVSRSSLSPHFKKQTGRTMLQYLNDIRYYKALHILAQESGTIRTIAKRCGFSDAAYFSHWFHKRSGKNPRDMKEKI